MGNHLKPLATTFPQPADSRACDETHISIVVPVVERFDDLAQLFSDFSVQIERITPRFEFLFVVDASQQCALATLRQIQDRDPRVRVLLFNGCFGESAALDAGFAKARGELVFTLASYYQVESEAFSRVYDMLAQADLVVTRRFPRVDSTFNRLQAAVFHGIFSGLCGIKLRDITCGFRGMRHEVARHLTLYGDLHRFIPALAIKRGFRVVELDAPQHPKDARTRIHGIGVYVRRLLDVFTLFFLMKFTKKPLRFFGALGAFTGITGFVLCAYLTVERLFFGQALADRPLLLLGILLLVGGIQTIAIGLIGEIIVYTHARHSKDYDIESIIE